MGDQAAAGDTLGRCGQATASGFRLRNGLSFDQWMSAGRQISKISNASSWWLGDWVLYGERSYGARYKAALELTSLDYKTLRNYAWVARRFELSRRRDNLSFQHHLEVASLPAAEQDLWLTRADTLRWSRNELRRQVAARQRAAPDGPDAGAVTVRIRVQAERERQWREAAEANRQPLEEWIAAAADEVACSAHFRALTAGVA